MLLTLFAAAALSVPSDGLSMRVSGAGLDLSHPADAAMFAARIAEESERFCASHRGVATPAHTGDARVCRRAMGREVVSRLPEAHWRAFARAGGMTALRRLQD
jgi:UrcA family protein